MAKNVTKDMRVFGIAMAVVLSGIGALYLSKDWPRTGWTLIGIGALFLIAAIFAVQALKPLYGPWMMLAMVLGFVMTRVILTIFYFIVLAPFGLVRRLFRKDDLACRLDPTAATHWNERDREPPPKARYERQF